MSVFSVRGTAPSYWSEIAETPTRVTFKWTVGGEEFSDMCQGNNYSLVERIDKPWAQNFPRRILRANEIPEVRDPRESKR